MWFIYSTVYVNEISHKIMTHCVLHNFSILQYVLGLCQQTMMSWIEDGLNLTATAYPFYLLSTLMY